MVVPQYERVEPDAKTPDRFGEPLAQVLPIAMLPDNRPPWVAPPRQVIPGADSFDPPWSGHAQESIRLSRRASIAE